MSGEEKGKSEERRRIRPGKIVLIVFVVLIVYICVFSLTAKFVNNESLPMPLGFGAATVLTGSMEPTLHENDLAIIAGTSQYSVGDIAIYQTAGTPVIHRIIEIDEEAGTVVLQGDANNAPDEPITVSRLKGKLLFRVPFVGWLMRHLHTVPGIIMILLLIFVLFALSVRAREKDAEESEKEEELKREILKLRGMGLAETPGEFEKYEDGLTETEREIGRLKKQLGLSDEKPGGGEKPKNDSSAE